MVAALDDATGVSYTELRQMEYAELLQLNLDVRAHAERKQEALDDELNQ
jgi:hypothetical protein